jgi:hypothetical protein
VSSARGIVATERGDVFATLFVSATGGSAGAAFGLRGSSWRRLQPPAELTDFAFSHVAGGLGAQSVAEGTNRDNSNGPVSLNGNFLLYSADGSRFARTPTTPSYSSGAVQGFATDGQGTFLLVIDGGRFERSADAGATWSAVTGLGGDAPAGPVTFVGDRTALVSVTKGPYNATSTWRLVRSTDAGATWAPALPGTGWFYSVVRGAGGRLLAFSRSVLYASNDDGATWARVELPLGGGDVSAAAVTPSGAVVLVVERQRGGFPYNAIYYSADGGGGWAAAEGGLDGVTSGPSEASADVELPWTAAHDEAIVRDDAGHLYLLLKRVNSETGADEVVLMRTTRPVP